MTRTFVVLSMSIILVVLYTQKKYQSCEVNRMAQGAVADHFDTVFH
jgi:hypothetical protein